MNILDSYDKSREIIKADEILKDIDRKVPEKVLAYFANHFDKIIDEFGEREYICRSIAGRDIPIYKMNYKGQEIGVYHTLLGGAGTALTLEEIIARGAKKVLFFGSCGGLDDFEDADILIPEAAYRDEGVSYHYMESREPFVEIPTAARLAQVMDEMEIPNHIIKTWTTDAFYRETEQRTNHMKELGCNAVEMECASIMAVAQYRGIEAYQFIYSADSLSTGTWERKILENITQDTSKGLMKIALEALIRL